MIGGSASAQVVEKKSDLKTIEAQKALEFANEKKVKEKGKDGYDKPGEALEFEIERTKNPVTGKVPWEKLRTAIIETDHSKQNAANRTAALSWIERGPDGDFTGPQGNPRPTGQQTAGRIRAMIVDSLDATHNTIIAGSVSGGLWKSTNINSSTPTWILVNDFLSNLGNRFNLSGSTSRFSKYYVLMYRRVVWQCGCG